GNTVAAVQTDSITGEFSRPPDQLQRPVHRAESSAVDADYSAFYRLNPDVAGFPPESGCNAPAHQNPSDVETARLPPRPEVLPSDGSGLRCIHGPAFAVR